MDITRIETNKNKNYYFNETKIKEKNWSSRLEFQVIDVYPDITYQEFLGFGGAITEASAYSYSLLPDNRKKEFIKNMFSDINYSFCRLTIGSCDFALGTYSYAKKHDLSDFNIERDKQYVIPFIKDALAVNPNIKFLASPWSPPSFMKNTKISILGGKLSNKYKQTYADYFVKYLNAYKDLGIKIDYVTVQNEPNAIQTWESCLYNSEEEVDFLVNYLYPTFQRNGVNTKILIYDQNKDKLFTRALAEFSNPSAKEAACGIALHWYTGDHFENVALCRQKFPDKLLIHTEGCSGYNLDNPWAPQYAHDIFGDLNAGVNGYIDWNILLDHKGGPNHKKNNCNSPVLLNCNNSDYNKTLAYYYIGQFSKVINPNAVRIAHSKYTSDIEMTAFKNPDNSIAVIIMNDKGHDVEFNLCFNDVTFKDTIEHQSIVSYLIRN